MGHLFRSGLAFVLLFSVLYKANGLRCISQVCVTPDGSNSPCQPPPRIVNCSSRENRCMTIRYQQATFTGRRNNGMLKLCNRNSAGCSPIGQKLICRSINQTGQVHRCNVSCCYGDLCNSPNPTNRPRPPTTQPNFRCGQRPPLSHSRVVSGENAPPGSWPWQVQLLYRWSNSGNFSHLCGGTLVHPRFVLTAAHCLTHYISKLHKLRVRLGVNNKNVNEPGVQEFRIVRAVIHPQYNKPTRINNDIAVLELDRPAIPNSKVNLACISFYDPPLNSTCYITGWGRVYGGGPSASILQQARMPIVTQRQCEIGNGPLSINVTSNMMCAGFGGNSTVSGCHGDSGGPFVCRDDRSNRWFLQGIVSWGSSKCAARSTYSVFTRVARYNSFIYNVMFRTPPPATTSKPPCPPQTTPPWTPPPTTRPPTRPPLLNISCDNDRHRCPFTQATDDNLDWTLHRGRTPSSYTGPDGDHTTGYGRYYYLEASYPSMPWSRAKMTMVLRTNYAACASFYYHMRGDTMGYLRVFLNGRLVWQLDGDQGNQWIKATVPLYQTGYQRITFEGIRGPGYRSDIALDDLALQETRHLSKVTCGLTPKCASPQGQKPPPPPPASSTRPPPVTTYPPWPPYNGSCGIPSTPQSRVVGGQNASRGSWPWQVALYVYDTRFVCGGSLIAPRWVVTAAHCIMKSLRYKVVLGDLDRSIKEGTEQSYYSNRTIVHPGYNRRSGDSDIALIYLEHPVRFNSFVRPVCLPKQGEIVPSGSGCFITGWGKIKHPGSSVNHLQQAKLPVLDETVCEEKLSSSGITSRNITDNMVCGGQSGSNKSGCHGDSGGPYVCPGRGRRWVLHGAVSWGSYRCDSTHAYTVFARVARFRAWIDRHMKTMG